MDHLKAVDTTDDLHNSNPPSIAGVFDFALFLVSTNTWGK